MTKQADWTALASGPRRTILEELAKGERTVTELAEAVKLSQPTVSQHIAVLRNAGLISGEYRPRPKVGGAWRVYRLEYLGLARLRKQYDDLLNRLEVRARKLHAPTAGQ